MKAWSALALWVVCIGVQTGTAQIIEMYPPDPGPEDSVILIFHAKEGNAALAGYDSGPVYMHTGLLVAYQPGWTHVQGEWGTDDARMKMKRIAPNAYQIRFHARSFYGLADAATVLPRMAFVFRDRRGIRIAKDSDNRDILYPPPAKSEEVWERAEGRQGRSLDTLTVMETQPDGSVWLSDGEQTLRIQMYEGPIFGIQYFPKAPPSSPQEVAIQAQGLSPIPFSLIRSDGATDFLSEYEGPNHYRVKVQRNPLRLIFYKGTEILLEEELGHFRQETPYLSVSGVRWKLGQGEFIVGTGARALPMNLVGQRLLYENVQVNGYEYGEPTLNGSAPLLFSSKGYGLYIEGMEKGFWDIGKRNPQVLEWGAKCRNLSYFVIPSQKPDEWVSTLTRLNGRQPLPPRWLLGYIQGETTARSLTEVQEMLDQVHRSQLPLDGIVLPSFSPSSLMVQRGHSFKNPSDYYSQWKKEGLHVLETRSPYIPIRDPLFAILDRKQLLVREAEGPSFIVRDSTGIEEGLMDIFQADMQQWLKQYARERQALGIAGWYSDRTEPEIHTPEMVYSRGWNEEVHNAYGRYWAKALWEAPQEQHPTLRPVNISRAASVGMSQYASFPRTGVPAYSWKGLRAQVPMMLHAGLSGWGYMHSDIGGNYKGGNTELMKRWIQLGSFSPIMRFQGNELQSASSWLFQDTEIQRQLQASVRLRYLLSPYTYTLAWENHRWGWPLARPMSWYEPTTSRAWSTQDAFFWGKNLWVAPVLEPGTNRKLVSFPEGNWINFYSGVKYEGGRTSTVYVNPDEIPVFVRAGSFLPLVHGAPPSLSASHSDTLAIHYYPAKFASKDSLYWDDGKTRGAFEQGQYELIYMDARKEKAWRVLRFTQTGEGYAGMPTQRALLLTIHYTGKPAKKFSVQPVGNDKRSSNHISLHRENSWESCLAKPYTAYYDEDNKELIIHVPWQREGFEVWVK